MVETPDLGDTHSNESNVDDVKHSDDATYLNNFNEFVNQLKIIFINNDIQQILNDLLQLSDNEKINNGKTFIELINNTFFDDFVKAKLKIFSHKSDDTLQLSESLFGPKLCIKYILNNQSEEIKKLIWTNLYNLYISCESLKPIEERDTVKIKSIMSLVNNKTNDVRKKIQDVLGTDINNHTTDMVNDIVSSFENIMSTNPGSNPLADIMGLSQKISVKYANKLNNGDIEIDKLLKCMTNKIPGMENMMSGEGGDIMNNIMSSMGDNNGMLGGLMGNMMGGNNEASKEKIIIDDNFSTSSVNVGPTDENKKNINFGNILKMADQFGVLPGGKQTNTVEKSHSTNENTLPDLSSFNLDELCNNPQLSKIMGMMNKLNSVNTPEEIEKLKNEVDTFLQNDMGVDINKINAFLPSANAPTELNQTEDNNEITYS
jgi:DNA-binding ferritin-like protein (Dps family)